MEVTKEAFVYMVTNDRGNVLYIGSTLDLKERVYFHKKGMIAGFTKKYNVHQLIYFERHAGLESARKRERELTDRGMYSTDNLELCLSAGIKKIAIQPKGKAQPLVSRRDHQKLANRRVAVEARIAHMKLKGLGKSRMKTDVGDLISGYRSALSCNLGHLMRDLAIRSVAMTQ